MKNLFAPVLFSALVVFPLLPAPSPGQATRSGPEVIQGKARFSLLGDGILRVEYAPDGRFDDRPTFRCVSMPAPGPFGKVKRSPGTLLLSSRHMRIRYTPDGKPPGPSNLVVRWKAGGMEGRWSPGDADPRNLGSIYTLDNTTRDFIPHGVYPGGRGRADRYGEDNLVGVWLKVQKEIQAHPERYGNLHLNANIFSRIFASLPAGLKKFAARWSKFPPGPVSASGWTSIDETGMAFYDPDKRWIDTRPRPGYRNLFFFCYGRDYRKAMAQYTALCGKIPLLPRWAFGSWFSCFQRLSAKDNQRIVEDYDKNRIPLDVLIVDMDWHTNGWNGWSWNRRLYPDPEAFFAWMRKKGVHVGMNVHNETISRKDPAYRRILDTLGLRGDPPDPPGIRMLLRFKDSWVLDYTDPRVWEAFREACYVPKEKQGVSFWWLDNWQGHQETFNSVLWIDHLTFRHMREDLGRRPILLGRYSGWGTHRYGACFTGDTASQWEVLAHELEVNTRAAQVGMAYLSHDLGGFKGPWPGIHLKRIDPELYIRWIQVGALSPIMRVHSHHGIREPWKYGPNVLRVAREAYRFHQELVPYLYHLARQAYDRGLPILRPLWFLYPEDGKTYQTPDEFFLGDKILAAPVVKPGGRRRIYLPAGRWFSVADGEILQGPLEEERFYPLDKIPLFVRAGSILPAQDPRLRTGTALPDPLVLRIYPGGEDELDLYEDEGDGLGYEKGAFTRWNFRLSCRGNRSTVILGPMKGGFPGCPARRNLRVEFHVREEPRQVLLDGKALEKGKGWIYRGEQGIVLVPLQGVDPRKRRLLVFESRNKM